MTCSLFPVLLFLTCPHINRYIEYVSDSISNLLMDTINAVHVFGFHEGSELWGLLWTVSLNLQVGPTSFFLSYVHAQYPHTGKTVFARRESSSHSWYTTSIFSPPGFSKGEKVTMSCSVSPPKLRIRHTEKYHRHFKIQMKSRLLPWNQVSMAL